LSAVFLLLSSASADYRHKINNNAKTTVDNIPAFERTTHFTPLSLLRKRFTIGCLLAVTVLSIRSHNFHKTGGGDEGKHFLVLCSEGTIHNAKDHGVDGPADIPQAGGTEENLKQSKQALQGN